MTKSGETFAFSDFETSNLRDFENFFLLHFDLRGGSFDELSELEKKREIQISKSFDIEQAKDIRFYLYYLIAVCVFLLSVGIQKTIENGLDFSAIFFAGILISTIILTLAIKQLRKAYKTLRGGVS